MKNTRVQDLLTNYQTLYDKKCWCAGIDDSTLTAENWGVLSYATGNSNRFGNAWECYGFSLFLAYILFGKR